MDCSETPEALGPFGEKPFHEAKYTPTSKICFASVENSSDDRWRVCILENDDDDDDDEGLIVPRILGAGGARRRERGVNMQSTFFLEQLSQRGGCRPRTDEGAPEKILEFGLRGSLKY